MCPRILSGETSDQCMMEKKKKENHTRSLVMAQLAKCVLCVLVKISIVVITHHDQKQKQI